MRKLFVVTALLLFAELAFGQTLQKGNLIGVHDITITTNEGYTVEQYIDYYEKEIIPRMENNLPGVELYFLKGSRGEKKNKIGLLFFVESVEVREKYWPSQGQPSAAYNEGVSKFQSNWDELNKIGTFTTVYTDWLVQ